MKLNGNVLEMVAEIDVEATGFGQREFLARKSGLSCKTVAEILEGRREIGPDDYRAEALAKALGLHVLELFEIEEEDTPRTGRGGPRPGAGRPKKDAEAVEGETIFNFEGE